MNSNQTTKSETNPDPSKTVESQLNEWLSEEQLAAHFPQFPKTSVHWWLRNRANNGLGPSVAKVSRRLLIHVPGFCDWLKSNTGR